ncbi:MAG: protein kinase [Verrucomicrobiota bacterium]
MTNPTDTATGDNIRFGLRAQLFLLVMASFGVLMGIIIWTIDNQARNIADQRIEKSLTQSRTILETRLAGRFDLIENVAGNLVRDGRLYPEIVAGLSATNTLRDRSSEFEKSLDFDILMITDDEGWLIARSDVEKLPEIQLAGRSHLFDTALSGEAARGFMSRQGELLQIVALPVPDNTAPDIIRGTLALAYRLSTNLTHEIRELTESHLALHTFRFNRETEQILPESYFTTMEEHGDALDGYYETSTSAWMKIYNNDEVDREVIPLAEDKYHAVFYPLTRSDGEPVGFMTALRSHSELMRPFKKIQNITLSISLCCMLVAGFIAFGIARHISGPIIKLVDVTHQIQAGLYPREKPKKRNDEVGILQNAVFRMSTELREKAELEEFLADVSASLDAPGTMDFGTHFTVQDELEPEPQEEEDDLDRTEITSGDDLDRTDIVAHDGETVLLPYSTKKGVMAPGSVFAERYRIQRQLGEGAMGVVYLARDVELDEQVALKTIVREGLSAAWIDLFKQELRLARRITHPNVLRNHDFGVYDGVHYISMEYVQGFNVFDLIRHKGPMDLRMGVMMARQICSALAAAHLEGIVHRDMKPENMMITKRGMLKIMDFGIASTVDEVEELQTDGGTGQTTVSGTPRYMSPEQFRGEKTEPTTDIYAVGVILYFLFSAKHPFEARSLDALADQHKNAAPPKLSDRIEGVPSRLDEIIIKAMSKAPEDRYQSANLLAADLADVSREL